MGVGGSSNSRLKHLKMSVTFSFSLLLPYTKIHTHILIYTSNNEKNFQRCFENRIITVYSELY